MSNIPDGFEEVIPEGFEEVSDSSAVDRIPGIQPAVQTKPEKHGLLGYTAGVGETALNALSSIPAGVIGPLAGLKAEIFDGKNGNQVAGQVMQDMTYHPRTELGQDMAEGVGEFMNSFGIPAAGVAHTIPMQRIPRIPKTKEEPRTLAEKIEPPKKNTIPDGFEEVQMELPLENSPQQAAEMRARQVGQRDLFAPENEPLQRVIPENTPEVPVDRSIETVAQHELFDQPEQGRVANPYEAKIGDWRVDENGIPIKADLSMEVANLENPLQRNLWGDELEPVRNPVGQAADLMAENGMQQGIPLTEAIDSMVWAQRRGAIRKELMGDIEAPGNLRAAIQDAAQEANGGLPDMGGVGRSQRGAINMEIFDPLFEKVKELSDGLKLVLKGHETEPTITAFKNGKQVGQVKLDATDYLRPHKDSNLQSSWTGVDTAHRNQGIAKEMYRFASELGNDVVPAKVQTADGKALWDSLEKDGLAQGGMIRGQRGALDINSIMDGLQKLLPSATGRGEPRMPVVKPDTEATPRSDATIAARQEKVAKVKAAPVLAKEFKEFDAPATIEEAYHLAEQTSDIKEGSLQAVRDNLSSGLRYKAVMTRHPILQYANKVLTDARAKAGEFSRTFITSRDGLASIGGRLTKTELTEVMELLQKGDKLQARLTSEQLRDIGANEKQIQFIEAFYKADKALLDSENAARGQLGMDLIREREGHFPGIFTGNYKTLVLNSKGQVVAVIATDTLRQQHVAQQTVKSMLPDAEFVGSKKHPLYPNMRYGDRQWLGGNYIRSDIFSGMNDIMKLLAQHDPKFGEIQLAIQETLKQDNNSLYGFNRHELEKKGVVGNEGNKPWKSREQNASDAFKAMVQYFEEGAQHFNLQVPLEELGQAVKDYGQTQPNMSSFLSGYLDHVKGGSSNNPVAKATNIALDAPFAALGIGSKVPYKMAAEVKNRMSHIFMGFGNWAFTLSQFAQLGQSAMPFMELTRQRLGMDLGTATKSAGKASVDFLHLVAEDNSAGKYKATVDSFSRQAYDYAKSRGMLDFSELEKAQEGTKNKALRALDTVSEVNMKIGESGTRPWAFMSIARMLADGGFPTDARTFFIAENLTQLAMIDYHPWERPRIYAKMGVAGQFAGGLTTFKHGYLSQQGVLLKGGKATPVLASVAAMAALSGIMGLPFYSELDELVKTITNKMGKQQTIKDIALKNLPDWANYGGASAATGVNWQGKFSSAEMIPNSPAQALSPHLTAAVKAGASVFDMIMNGADEQSIRNVVMAVAPNGPIKGNLEAALAKTDRGEVVNKQGLGGYPRTPEEWAERKRSGLISLQEQKYKDQRWETLDRRQKDAERKREISDEVRRLEINGEMTFDKWRKLTKEYFERGGDPKTLLSARIEAQKDKAMGEKQRDQGIPSNSIPSIRRYQDFNQE